MLIFGQTNKLSKERKESLEKEDSVKDLDAVLKRIDKWSLPEANASSGSCLNSSGKSFISCSSTYGGFVTMTSNVIPEIAANKSD